MTRLLRECSKEFFRKGIPVRLPEDETLPCLISGTSIHWLASRSEVSVWFVLR